MMKKSLHPSFPCLGRDELFVATEYLEKNKNRGKILQSHFFDVSLHPK